MKRITAYILLIAMISIFALASCDRVTDERPCVIGTVFPQYDFARQIGGEDIRCEMLLPPGADSHGYTGDDPSDIYRIMNCDVFIYVGGETDSDWVEKIKTRLSGEEHKPIFISMCDVCETIEEDEGALIEKEEHEEEHHEGERDEHVWTSPKNAVLISEAIKDALCETDPANADKYGERFESYKSELLSLDKEFRELSEKTDNKTLVFADRFPFRYFANEYGYRCFAAFNGCASQSEPTPTTIVELCRIINENSLPCVYYIETSHSGVPELICKNTGCEKLLLHSCHTITERELKDGATYLSLMRRNLENLKKAGNNG